MGAKVKAVLCSVISETSDVKLSLRVPIKLSELQGT